jgi:MoxR-like ATPase
MPTTRDPDQMHADDVTAIDELRGVYGRLKKELSRVIVGQEQVIEHLSICLFSRGHALDRLRDSGM